MSVVFYWIGVGAVGAITIAAVFVGLVFAYFYLIAGRFQLILFRKTQRRLSLAAWHGAKLMSDEYFHADDFPITQRPLFASYRIGKRHLFFMAGLYEDRRHMPISGKHPDYSA